MTDLALRLTTDAAFRDRVETIAQNLIDLLDETQIDPDLEPNGDLEPSLGFAELQSQFKIPWTDERDYSA
jgi:hypothetical protein